MDKKDRQIKSKKRVADHGEVFTSSREVKAMCDLVASETERIDSRFLEPACGHGNFLEEILRRKLRIVKKTYRKDPYYFELYSFVAVSGLYGIDLLEDNVKECRKRLFGVWKRSYASSMKALGKEEDERVKNAVSYVFEKNILCGDALKLVTKDKIPIVFSEWSVIDRAKRTVKRRDF